MRVEGGSGKIEEAYAIFRAKDVEFHQLNQVATLIEFLPIVPPKFDSEINENIHEKKPKDERNELEIYLDLRLLAVGCNKGTVVFFRIDNFEFIYTRVTYHREQIIQMQAFNSCGNPYLVTICEERFLKLVKFDEEKANCILSLYMGASFRQMHAFEDRLALVFKKGFFELF